jgi:hypothetical protein
MDDVAHSAMVRAKLKEAIWGAIRHAELQGDHQTAVELSSILDTMPVPGAEKAAHFPLAKHPHVFRSELLPRRAAGMPPADRA